MFIHQLRMFKLTELCAYLLCVVYIHALVLRCVEYLLDNGADPCLCNSKGYSAVHYAAAHGNKQSLELVRKKTHWGS